MHDALTQAATWGLYQVCCIWRGFAPPFMMAQHPVQCLHDERYSGGRQVPTALARDWNGNREKRSWSSTHQHNTSLGEIPSLSVGSTILPLRCSSFAYWPYNFQQMSCCSDRTEYVFARQKSSLRAEEGPEARWHPQCFSYAHRVGAARSHQMPACFRRPQLGTR